MEDRQTRNKVQPATARHAHHTDEIGQAVERVLQHYRNDLSAFIRDVQRETAKSAEAAQSKPPLRE